jgi:hypothetical protein
MPRALERPVVEQVAQRHRKMLVRADIAQRGDLSSVANETDRITTWAHALENRPLGEFSYRSHGFELRISGGRIENGPGSTRHSGPLM